MRVGSSKIRKVRNTLSTMGVVHVRKGLLGKLKNQMWQYSYFKAFLLVDI